ncbi:hypothetical protein CLV30_10890 [Haloactinopolyspora alba]|uniref:Peptide subunit release factor 1 (ERF1) n=1 Tax=Haloactinopolyspora alba TaxID=648780 RepID=A0A2P8E143_9ACTN|nr:VLRF1 family aeRF1-type release factor [Haloactinopolyspora alba]PSL03178.1 hypothetical protein CLV30_10890 [Haloactinopolyspora alba]
MTLSRATLRNLTGMNDEMGVLSIYANADPRAEHTQDPAWQKRLRSELGQLKDGLKTTGSREQWQAFAHRVNSLRDDLDWLLDRSEPGQGRALFTGIADGATERVSLQTPLVNRVVFDPRAHVWPLVSAWSSCGPAGVVAVSADMTRLVDVRFGTTYEPANVRYDPGAETRELKGPRAAHPGAAQHSAPQHDLYERRESDRLLRRVRQVGADVASFATEYGWEYVVVTGEANLTHAVVEGLPAGFTPTVVELEHPVRAVPAPKLAEMVQPALAQARRRRGAELARRACDDANSGNAAACGLPKTLLALSEARVAHLLLASDGEWRGRRMPDGSYVPATTETVPGDVEPFLGERMIEAAHGERAAVTVVDGEAAVPLEDGVGAILRW